MTMITDNPERATFEALGRDLDRPGAIICVTAHWETRGSTRVTSAERPHTIHDFRGFPQELYDMQYPAPGDPALAQRVVDLIGDEGFPARLDPDYGFDHGVWGTLKPMFPAADIPVVAVSVNMSAPPERHLDIGRRLAPLRDDGSMIVARGHIVHTLMLWRQTAGTKPDWAVEFQSRINKALVEGDERAISFFTRDDKAAGAAINSGEHYLPLLYAAGARLPGDVVSIFNDNIDGALSMTSAAFGEAEPFAAYA